MSQVLGSYNHCAQSGQGLYVDIGKGDGQQKVKENEWRGRGDEEERRKENNKRKIQRKCKKENNNIFHISERSLLKGIEHTRNNSSRKYFIIKRN